MIRKESKCFKEGKISDFNTLLASKKEVNSCYKQVVSNARRHSTNMINRYKLLFTILISINGLILFGQSSDLILIKEQNDKWFDSLETLSLDRQLDLIKTRILQDTIVFNSNQLRSDRVILDNLKKEELLKEYGNIANGRVLYFVRYKHKLLKKYKFLDFQWSNWTSTLEIKKFHDFLTIDKINDIEIITDDKNEMAIFGSMAGFGVIIFDLNRRKYIKEYRNLNN